MNAKSRVIVVEDYDLLRQFLKKYVDQSECCQVVAEAVCGIQALEVIKDVPAELILLDLSMPGMSGLLVLREAKKISSAKVLVVTMTTDEGIIQQALEAGADGIVLKDQGAKVLERAIVEILDGKRPVYLDYGDKGHSGILKTGTD